MLGSDWKSFEAAAMRVRILNHHEWWGEMTYKIDPNVFRSLACAAQGRTGLLPRLQQLVWETSNDDIYPYISLFLSPTITNLVVSVTNGNVASDRMRFSLLASLVSRCSSVRSLELRSLELCARPEGNTEYSWRDLFSNHSSSAFASFSLWTSLDVVNLNDVDLSTLADVLAGLAVLTTLKLNCCRIIDPLSPSTVQGFPMLQHLTMDGNDIDSCLHVLKRMSCTPLVHLDLRVTISRESQWAELFRILPDRISRDSLATVSFRSPIQDNSGRSVPMCFQTVSPLLQFRRVAQFTHSVLPRSCSSLDLGDSDVACIAKAWPCLNMLAIHSPVSVTVSSRLTLRAFIPLVKYCPDLEALSMKINATTVDDYDGKGLYSGRLRKLCMFDSPIGDLARVAALISDIFPYVELSSISVIFPRSDMEDLRKLRRKWDEVGRIIVAAQRKEAKQTK
jgi:hypothetical protein